MREGNVYCRNRWNDDHDQIEEQHRDNERPAPQRIQAPISHLRRGALLDCLHGRGQRGGTCHSRFLQMSKPTVARAGKTFGAHIARRTSEIRRATYAPERTDYLTVRDGMGSVLLSARALSHAACCAAR